MRRYARFLLLLTLITFGLGLRTPNAAQAQSEVAEPFRTYYRAHQGLRILGRPLTSLVDVDGVPAQYFEKGRIEDHRGHLTDPRWSLLFGRLTDELITQDPQGTVNNTNTTYRDLGAAHRPEARVPAPPNFQGGTLTTSRGEFVPYDSQLRPAPGYHVPRYFWTYINRRDLFPGGWLHDIGLPMTNAFQTQTVKAGVRREMAGRWEGYRRP